MNAVEARALVSSPEVLEELRGIYCPRCGEWGRPGVTVDGAFVHMLTEHPRVAEILITRYLDSHRLIAWALDIPEGLR